MIDKINKLRQDIMRVAMKNKKGHIASSLSCLDILVVLFYEEEFSNDTIILSKAHGCYGLYAIEADLGKISKEDWENFNLCGIYDGLGSLGHGLPIAVGLAFGRRLQNNINHTFCIVGDGEMQEGSCWEALSFMKHYNLRNITVIIDNNGLQAFDRIDNVLEHDLMGRLKGWGFIPFECDGHDYNELLRCIRIKPQVIIANTIKGKGFPFMEGIAKWHYRVPNEDDYKR